MTLRGHYVTVAMHMRPFVPTPFRWLTALLVVGTAMMANGQQRAAGSRPAGIQFIEPESDSFSTNNFEEADKAPSLRGLSSSIRKPFSLPNASDSFSGTVKPQALRAPPSPAELKRMNELRDRKKNWAFLTPEEIYGVKTPEEIMNVPEFGPNGERLEPKTALERFIARMENSRAVAVSNQANHEQLSVFAELMEQEEADAAAAGEEEKPLLDFMANQNGPESTRPGMVQAFSSALTSPGPAAQLGGLSAFDSGKPVSLQAPLVKDPARETSLQEFKKLLETRTTLAPALNTGLGISAGVASPSPFGLGGPANDLGGAEALPRPTLSTPTTFGIAPSFTPAFSPPPEMPSPSPRLAPAAVFELPKRKY